MIALGDVIPASEALRIGMVNRVLPKDGFMPNALMIAKTLLMVDQNRMREVIQLLRNSTVNDEQGNIEALSCRTLLKG